MNEATLHPERRSELGMALITGLMLLFMASSLLVGFLTVVMADSRVRRVDKTRTQSFYAAYAGLEKLTSDIGNLFVTDFSPAPAQLEAIEATPPAMPQVDFTAQDGLGYAITYPGEPGLPVATPRDVTTGPFEGLKGLITTYTLTTTARTTDGSESRVMRAVNTVSLPVFQFGIFSDLDLTFSANQLLSFGGRVHTNGNLWLTAATGGTTELADRVTVFGEVIRTHLANGRLNDGTHEGTVRVTKGGGVYRTLLETEGSVLNNLGSAVNDPTWYNLSIGTYNSYIRNNRTGAKRLDLPFVAMGATPIDLIKRPVAAENAFITEQRMFTRAQIRILLSDTSLEITNLPGVSANTTPLAGGLFNGVPVGQTTAPSDFGVRSPLNTSIQSGFLKVEYRNAAGIWTDVTAEWLGLGFTKKNFDALLAGVPLCLADPQGANAIIRFQRVRADFAALPMLQPPCGTANLDGTGALNATPQNYWPLALYDQREAWPRDNLATNGINLYLGGIIHYVELDVNNLNRWLLGQIGVSGVNVVDNATENGYAIYFSDRRLNKNGVVETGEYGFEDHVNPGDANGTPNGALNDGEDLNGNLLLDNYGMTPPAAAVAGWQAPWTAASTPAGAWPRTLLTNACQVVVGCATDTPMNKARSNPAVLFRRALKVVNGGLGSLPAPGLTIASENPVYVEGNFNATAAGFGTPNAPAAILADAITLLSSNWSVPLQIAFVWYGHGDTRSFNDPNDSNARPANSTRYRFAALAGKIRAFNQLNLPASFGTDGGIHNFLRLIENWNGDTVFYNGAVASFFYSRQAIGLFRCCNNVYQLPARNFAFDTNFLDPTLLPPKTPMFQDVNTTRFRYVTR